MKLSIQKLLPFKILSPVLKFQNCYHLKSTECFKKSGISDMMLASFVGPVGAIGCTVGTQTILNRISGYI